MTRFQTQFTSAFAAILIVTASFGAMFNAAPAQAQHIAAIELA
jgi:hypothetical protein